jgi:hypothetical protein
MCIFCILIYGSDPWRNHSWFYFVHIDFSSVEMGKGGGVIDISIL